MIQFAIKSRVQPIGTRKGQTVYYAQPKMLQRMDTSELVEQIVLQTSLTEGDVRSALVTMKNIICSALKAGRSVDMGELGSLSLTITSKMMDSPEAVTKDTLNKPRIIFNPKGEMRAAANAVEISIDRSSVTKAGSSKPNTPEEGGGTTPGGSGGDETVE